MTTREDEKISFYTIPRDVHSHNGYTKNCLVQERKLYANGMQMRNTSNDTAVILNA